MCQPGQGGIWQKKVMFWEQVVQGRATKVFTSVLVVLYSSTAHSSVCVLGCVGSGLVFCVGFLMKWLIGCSSHFGGAPWTVVTSRQVSSFPSFCSVPQLTHKTVPQVLLVVLFCCHCSESLSAFLGKPGVSTAPRNRSSFSLGQSFSPSSSSGSKGVGGDGVVLPLPFCWLYACWFVKVPPLPQTG